MIMDARLGEAALRESDLLAFQIAIERGRPGSVMCAYNQVNGDYACENDFLLNQVLKRDWAYPGWVMSDWGAVHSTVDAANNGLDQESSYTNDKEDYFGVALGQAVAAGTVPETRLHDMVHRILRSMFAKCLFDNPAVKQPIDGLILSNTVRSGVIGLAKSLSNELAPFNITVNSVCPGYTLTERVRSLAGAIAAGMGTIHERRDHYVCHPEEVRAIIEDGNDKAARIAKATLAEVRETMKINHE